MPLLPPGEEHELGFGVADAVKVKHAIAEEKLQTMRAFGAQLEVLPSEGGKITPALIQAMIARTRELSTEPNSFWTDQFNNPDNRAGYLTMAREVIDALGGTFDEFVMGVGTGGCFSGNAMVYKEKVAGVRCVAIEPEKSRVLSGHAPTGSHRLEGMGAGFITSITRVDLIDEIVAVSDDVPLDDDDHMPPDGKPQRTAMQAAAPKSTSRGKQ